MMSKKKRIANLEREVNVLQNNLDLSQKAGLATAGGLAIVSITSLINSALTKKKVKTESNGLRTAISMLAKIMQESKSSSDALIEKIRKSMEGPCITPETETPCETNNDATAPETETPTTEEKAEEEESEEDDSKQPKVQLIGSFSGPELQSQLLMFGEFLSMIDFEHEYKFSLQTLKSSCLLFIAEADDNISISHMEPSYILDGNICGDDGLYFIVYLPDCKIKVAVNDEAIEIAEI